VRELPPEGTVIVAAQGWHDEQPGGANKLPTDFARFLAARGHHVSYVTPSTEIGIGGPEVVDGVELYRYPAPRATSPSVRNVTAHWRLTRSTVDQVSRAMPVRALLGHAPLQYLAASGRIADDVRRCYGVHSPFEAELREGATGVPTLKQRASWRGARWIERRLLRRSDVVHYHSTFTKKYMEEHYPSATRGKGVVLPGWVDDDRFRPPSTSRDELRRRLGAPWVAGCPTFFTLRRLVPRMGLDTLLEAAAQLANVGRVFRLVIGGDGPQRAALEARAAASGIGDRVAFLGRIPEIDLVDAFGAADCFVLPTRALECFGLIVLESFACGVPVVGVPVGSIPEVMGSDWQAWVATDNSAPAIAERMDDVLSGRLTADRRALRARAASFSMATVAERHERVLLGGPREETGHAAGR
jgi:glycosyltransferase involved in cell wall biosynthesis